MNRDIAYLRHIIDEVALIREFTTGVDRAQFEKNREKQSAVILQLTLIGEMTKRVSKEVRDQIELPWKDIAGFRDRAIHDYYTLDLNIVWATLSHDLDIIHKQISQWLNLHDIAAAQ